MNKSIWLPNGSGSLADRQYETSIRIDQKRSHWWITDSSVQDQFISKKQAVEHCKETLETAVLESSLRHSGSEFQPESQTTRPPSLFSTKPVWSSNSSDDNSIPPITASKNMEEKGPANRFGNDPSICQTMSHAVKCSLSLNLGTRKEKVNEARFSENYFPKFVGSTFTHEEKNEIMTASFQRTGNNMFSGPMYTALGNAILMDPAYSKIDENFVSVGNSNKRHVDFMATNHNWIENNVLSSGQVFNRRNYNVNAVREQYEKENGSTSVCPINNRGKEILFAGYHFRCGVKQAFTSAGPYKEDRHIAFHGQQDATVASIGTLYYKEDSSILSMVEHSGMGEETAICFRGLQNNVKERDHSSRRISSCDVLLNQSSAQSSGALSQKYSIDQLTANATTASSSRADGGASKNKDQKTKKVSSNNFPCNVKSLLSTGILDGVPVKYVSWSREKSLRAVVKLTGYLCSCQNCKLSKTLSAYEFEHHAGCKTKHPTNHIYFENGKSIYAVVQELKRTPPEMLFEAIQNVTGSAVNQKNFNTWKASYEIATRELERVFGKDDLVAPS